MRISNKIISLLAGSLFVIGLGAGTNAGCGSSSSDNASACSQACDRAASCLGDAAASLGLSKSECMTQCTKTNSTTTCSNASTITAGFQNCLKQMDCAAYALCLAAIPECTGGATGGSSGTQTGGSSGTGTGGAGGHATGATGGTTGSAGTGGTADCSICDKAAACCTATGLSTSCSSISASACNAAGAQQATIIAGCQSLLQSGATQNIAACK